MTEIIDFDKYKKGGYSKKEQMTLEECIKELDEMIPNATPRQQTALSVGINLIIEYIRGIDDLK